MAIELVVESTVEQKRTERAFVLYVHRMTLLNMQNYDTFGQVVLVEIGLSSYDLPQIPSLSPIVKIPPQACSTNSLLEHVSIS